MERKLRRQVLALREVEPGMRLAEDVRSPSGGVLAPAGSEIDESLLAGLRRRRIEIVAVDRVDERTPEAIVAEQAETEARIERLFHRHAAEPQMQALQEVVREYRLKALA